MNLASISIIDAVKSIKMLSRYDAVPNRILYVNEESHAHKLPNMGLKSFNPVSKLDLYPLPKTADLFAKFKNGKLFSKLDRTSCWKTVCGAVPSVWHSGHFSKSNRRPVARSRYIPG